MSDTATRTAAFELATKLDAPEFFTVDGTAYDLLGLDHLNTDEEAEVMGMFTSYDRIVKEYENAASDSQGTKIAKAMIEQRIRILARVTTMPENIARALPVSAQIKVFSHISSMLPDVEKKGD